MELVANVPYAYALREGSDADQWVFYIVPDRTITGRASAFTSGFS